MEFRQKARIGTLSNSIVLEWLLGKAYQWAPIILADALLFGVVCLHIGRTRISISGLPHPFSQICLHLLNRPKWRSANLNWLRKFTFLNHQPELRFRYRHYFQYLRNSHQGNWWDLIIWLTHHHLLSGRVLHFYDKPAMPSLQNSFLYIHTSDTSCISELPSLNLIPIYVLFWINLCATEVQCSQWNFGGQSNVNTHFEDAYSFLTTKKYLFIEVT